MSPIIADFYNAFYIRSSPGPRYLVPEFPSRGGVSNCLYWYQNLDGQRTLRYLHELRSISSCAVGGTLPFSDIVYVKMVFARSQDPEESSFHVIDVCMCYHAYDGIRKAGLAEGGFHETPMPWDGAALSKHYFEGIAHLSFGNDYKKKLHNWLRQEHQGPIDDSPPEVAAKQPEDKIIVCARCPTKLRVPANKTGVAQCPKCGHKNAVAPD